MVKKLILEISPDIDKRSSEDRYCLEALIDKLIAILNLFK